MNIIRVDRKQKGMILMEFKNMTNINDFLEAMRKGYFRGNVSAACRGIYKSGDTGKLIGDGHFYKGHKWSYEEEK